MSLPNDLFVLLNQLEEFQQEHQLTNLILESTCNVGAPRIVVKVDLTHESGAYWSTHTDLMTLAASQQITKEIKRSIEAARISAADHARCADDYAEKSKAHNQNASNMERLIPDPLTELAQQAE